MREGGQKPPSCSFLRHFENFYSKRGLCVDQDLPRLELAGICKGCAMVGL